MNPLEGILIFLLILLAFSGNILWYWMKNILKQNGYEVYAFAVHWADFGNMVNLIRRTKEVELKRKYKSILWLLLIILIIFISSAYLLIVRLDSGM